jgi:hypothetical protein
MLMERDVRGGAAGGCILHLRERTDNKNTGGDRLPRRPVLLSAAPGQARLLRRHSVLIQC